MVGPTHLQQKGHGEGWQWLVGGKLGLGQTDREESGYNKSASTTNESPVAPLPPMPATAQHPPEPPWHAAISQLAAQGGLWPKAT